jgi:hypothetical protein
VINRNEILGKLEPFKNYQVIVSHDQTVGEIIDGILMTHEKYKKEYDKISEYFIGDNEIETAQNIWNFLKSNVPYYIEDTKNQTLRSPSAIFAMPGDCKSYSLAANGILDSLNRKGVFNIPLAYRFASYKENNREPQHVFSVLYPGTNKEIWIDPVLKRFNEKRQPTFYKDKKLKMALIAMSGVESANKSEQLEAYRDRLVNERDRFLVAGKILPGSSKELEYKVAINNVTRQIQDAGISGFGEIATQVGNFYIGADTSGSSSSADSQDNSQAIADTIKIVTELFANKPNPNDWMGWDALDTKIGAPSGTNVLQWVILDGDSVQNEALNIVSYIKAKGLSKLLGYSTWFNRTITINDIADKLARGGFQQEAAIIRAGKQITPITPGSTPGTTTVAGMNIWVILALAGAGIYLISKKK